MFIAHMPVAYLLGLGFVRRFLPEAPERVRQSVIATGIAASILPDFDLLYFYLVDSGVTHHHFFSHWPLFWLFVVAAATGICLSFPHTRRFPPYVAIAGINLFAHMVMDSVASSIYWLEPFAAGEINLVHVPRLIYPWFLNFLFHWTFLVEISLCAFSFAVWWRQRQKCGRKRAARA